MKDTKMILAGIGFVLFGLTSHFIFLTTEWTLSEISGALSPWIGIGLIIFGLFTKEK